MLRTCDICKYSVNMYKEPAEEKLLLCITAARKKLQRMQKARTILYVDDDPDDREFFEFAFQHVESCLNLKTASDGFDALEKLGSEEDPAGIYIDINMPKMNGMELLRIIKSNPAYASIPAFIFSTTVDANSVEEAKRLGAVGAFAKPNSFKALIDQLQSNFSNYRNNNKLPDRGVF